MARAWGDSWGDSWADSWGTDGVEEVLVADAGTGPDELDEVAEHRKKIAQHLYAPVTAVGAEQAASIIEAARAQALAKTLDRPLPQDAPQNEDEDALAALAALVFLDD